MTQLQPYLEKDLGGHWRTILPQIAEDTYEQFWEVNEYIQSQPKKAEKELIRIITICGNGNIDAILRLADLYTDTEKQIEGNALVHKAHLISLEAFPTDFDFDKEELLWGHHDNRPILRTFASVGIEYMKEGQFEKAIEKFEQLIKLNPGDNQGVRFLLPECLLFLKRYNDFLNYPKTEEETNSLEYLYAKVFAYFKLSDFVNAKATLLIAKKEHPFIAEELLKTKHIFPANEFDRPLYGIPYGSRQAAFEYWERTKELWEGENEFKKFLADN